MKSTYVGREAESAVAKYLTDQGFSIVDQNWRTRLCEIDVIAKKKDIVYFCEVKYRGSNGQGSGLEYITPKKLKQMKLASQIWCADNSWGGDYRLLGAEVSGDDYRVAEVVEL